jgi:beta-glucosidase
MTFQEKQQQLRAQTQTNGATNVATGLAPAIPRLGVPAYDWWNEALHGIARSGGTVNAGGKATDFPTGLGLAASWDRNLVLAAETVVSNEARAFTNYYNTNVAAHNKGLTYWSPTINMHRDPRWGRAEETYGEDPYLTGEIGSQFTLGLQGGNESDNDSKSADENAYLKAVATPKHFLANNAENVRHTGTADLTAAELREYYTPAFAKLVSPEVGAKSIMTAYNHVSIDGGDRLPMSANFPILQDALKRTWGFDGVVTSDCDAIRDSWDPRMIAAQDWVPSDVEALGNVYNGQPSWDQPSGIAYTLKAGTDLDCMDTDYTFNTNPAGLTSTANRPTGAAGLQVSAANGYISEADLDASLVRAFTVRMQFGEFDNGGRDNAAPASGTHSPLYGATPWGDLTMANAVDTASSRALAEKAAAAGTVLLKNDGILPLAKPNANTKVVVVGHMAQMAVHGDYSPQTSFEYNLSAARAVKEYVAGQLRVSVDSLTDANYQWIPGFDMTGKWGWKKPNLGRSLSGSPAAVRFLASDGTELGRISPFDLYKSGQIDGWRGSQPWGPLTSATASLTNSGAWGGYFATDVTIPAGTAQITVEQTFANNAAGRTYDAVADETCFAVAGWTGEFDVRVGERFTGKKIGTVDSASAGKYCTSGNIAANQSASVLARSVQLQESQNGYVANRLAGTKTKLYFEYSSNFGFDGFTDAEKASISGADVVIGYAGTTALQSLCATNPDDPGASCGAGTSAASDSSEDEDRSNLDLPRSQDKVIKAAAELNPNTIAWLSTVSQVNVEPFKDKVAAIAWTTYNGQAQSRNITDVLWGEVNPSGRLPFTWYTDIRELPDTPDYQMTPDYDHNGRTYQYFTGDISYPFGHGLSYAKFAYSDLRLDSSDVDVNGSVKATVNVKNVSKVKGQEVVQLYAVGPKAGKALRPDKQLKGFEKIELAAGKSKDVTIELKAADLWFWDSQADHKTFDLGEWKLYLGPNSDLSNALSADITLSGSLAAGIDIVTAIPDGVILNTEVPGNVIHANLSATRLDQSFYDLSKVEVEYTSSDPAVAVVDSFGAVSPVSAGVALITAKVTADDTSKTTNFPVVVHTGTVAANHVTGSDAPAANPSETLFATLVGFADQEAELSDDGAQLVATLFQADDAPAADPIKFRVALAEENTAGATVTPDGVLTAQRPGVVRVTAYTNVTGGNRAYTHTATIKVVNKAELQASVADAVAVRDGLDTSQYTPVSVAGLDNAIADAQALLADPSATQAQIDAALQAITDAVAGLSANTSLTAVAVTIADRAWTGKKLSAGFEVEANGVPLVLDTDYRIDSVGANKNIGKGSVKITGIGDYRDQVNVSFKIVPKANKVSKASVGKKKVKVTWSKASKTQKVTGYSVQYRVKGTDTWKTKTVKGASKGSVTITKLKKGKAYEFRVRVYKTVSKTKYYSAYSPVKASGKVK